VLEMVGMDEVDPAAADHLVAPIAQYGFAARADLNHAAPRIQHHDQVLRGLEDAAKLFALLPQGLLGAVSFGDVADHFRYADGRARRRLDRRNAERDLDRAAILAQSRRFIVLDAFAPADPAQAVLHL